MPLLLNSSVNAVRGGDKKWSDPHTESVEVISITLAFISTGWLKMIRDPELKLILRDWLSITRECDIINANDLTLLCYQIQPHL